MRTRTRRRLDAALVVAGGLALGGVAVGAGALSDTERVRLLWARAELTPAGESAGGAGGEARITELVDYDFGIVSRHGIFRDVPGLSPETPVAVDTDAPDDLEVTPTSVDGEAGAHIRIGDPSTTVSGRHRYRIEYPLPAVVEGSVVDWDAVGSAWEVPIEEAELHVVAPFELERPDCFVGAEGSLSRCDVRQVEPGHLVATARDIDPGEAMSIEAAAAAALATPPTPPQPPAEPEPDPGTGLLPPAAAAAAAALAAGVPAVVVARRAGRERVAVGGPSDAAWAGGTPGGVPAGDGYVRVDQDELAAMATTEFAPPEGLSPPQGGIVLTEQVRPEHKVAWLVDAAIDGAVELVEEGGKTVRLVRTGPGTGDAAGGTGTTDGIGTAGVLDAAFRGRDEIELDAYDADFARAWGQLGGRLEAWRHASDLWDRRADGRRVLVLVLGIVAAVVGAAGVAAGAAAANRWGAPWLALTIAGGLLAGAGLGAALSAWELRVRTPAGSGAWLRVESFRRFLAGSEAYHAEEAAKRGVLREYTAWAIAVGEIDRWSRAVAASTRIPQDAGLSYAYVAPLLLASTSTAATAPSSSGGGGGGMGSVGGGAGGGGGGSW